MKKIKSLLPYIINTIIILAIFLVNLKIKKIFPFGNIDLSIYDATYQYKPMLYNFITSLKTGTILPFNFFNALGNPTIFNYLYYLSSPINLVALPFNNPNTMYFMVILTKTIITSIISLFYFKKRTQNNFISIICSVSYLFSGWFLAYYFNIMWLDAFMVLPLLQYGLEELINNNKYNIYIFSLTYIMFSNFYMAFILCLYILIYYLYNLILKKDKYINKIKNFQLIFISTIVTCLLSAFIIYATYSSFLKMGIYISSDSEFIPKLSLLNIIKSFLYANVSYNLSFNNNIPNICLPTIFSISMLYYFINKDIKLNKKITTLIAIIFSIFALCSPTINFIINCFHIPAGYNFRYSFIISFYILLIFIQNYKTFHNKIDIKIYLINLIAFILLVVEYINNNIEFNLFIFNLAFLINYTILFIFYNKTKIYKLLFITVFIAEVFVGYNLSLKNSESIIYHSLEKNSSNYREKIDNDIPNEEIINFNLYSNTSTLETFSSMQYNTSISLLYDLGCATDLKAMIYSCNNTEAFNMLFNVKGEYNLPKIYSVNNDIYLYNIDTDNFITNQNNLIKGMTNIDNVIIEYLLEPSSKEKNIYIINEKNEYIIPINPNIKYIRINNKLYTNNKNNIKNQNNLIINEDLFRKKSISANLKVGDEIEIEYYQQNSENKLLTYIVDKEKLNKVYDILNEHSINYTSYNDSLIEGTINVDEKQLIFTSIPYDESWNITVDGKKVQPIIIFDSLLGIEIEPGNHTIKLEYKNNFQIAIFISISTFICLLINIIIKKKQC